MSNASVIKSGHKKISDSIKSILINVGYEYAQRSLLAAVQDWDSSTRGNYDLTGNTRNGFVAAVYWNGTMARVGKKNPITVDDIDGLNVEDVTSTTTSVGMGGFRDYSSGEMVESVRNYRKKSGLSFQNTGIGQYSKVLSLDFVKNYKPSISEGVSIVVANCTPYGEYLLEMRKLDILDSRSSKAAINQDVYESIVKFAKQLEK